MTTEEIIGIILVFMLAVGFSTVFVTWWRQRQPSNAAFPKKKKRYLPDPPRARRYSPEDSFERSYDYRMIIGHGSSPDGRWDSIEIYNYIHEDRDWPHGGQIIRNMSQAELDGYFQSLTVNGWARLHEPEDGLPLIVYYQRPIDHPLKRQ